MRIQTAFLLVLVATATAFTADQSSEELAESADTARSFDKSRKNDIESASDTDLQDTEAPQASPQHRDEIQSAYRLWLSVVGADAEINRLKRKLCSLESEEKKRVSGPDDEKVRQAKEKFKHLKKMFDSIFSVTEDQRSELFELADEIDAILEELVDKHQAVVEEAEEKVALAQEAIRKEQSVIDGAERNLIKSLTPMDELKRDLKGRLSFSYGVDRGTQFARTRFPSRVDYWLEYVDQQVAYDFVRSFEDAYPLTAPGEEEEFFAGPRDGWWILNRSADMGDGRRLHIHVFLLRERGEKANESD